MADNDEKILKALENLQSGQKAIHADVSDVKKAQQEQGSAINRIATAIKTLATKQDAERVEKEVDKVKKGLRPRHAD